MYVGGLFDKSKRTESVRPIFFKARLNQCVTLNILKQRCRLLGEVLLGRPLFSLAHLQEGSMKMSHRSQRSQADEDLVNILDNKRV